MTVTGVWRTVMSFFRRASTRQPSMSGRKMSSRIAAGWNSFSSVSAGVPCVVTTPLKPWSRALSSSTRAKARSFSTISTVRSPGCTASRSSSASFTSSGGTAASSSASSGGMSSAAVRSTRRRSAAWRAASIAALATAAASDDLRWVRDGGNACGR